MSRRPLGIGRLSRFIAEAQGLHATIRFERANQEIGDPGGEAEALRKLQRFRAFIH